MGIPDWINLIPSYLLSHQQHKKRDDESIHDMETIMVC